MAEVKKFLFDNFTIDGPKKEKSIPQTTNIDPIEEQDTPPKVVEKTFSEAEVEEKLKSAEIIFYQSGFNEAKEKSDKEQILLLKTINAQLKELLITDDNLDKEYEKNFSEFGTILLEKLIPTLEKQEAQNIIVEFLTTNFKNFKAEKKLSIYLNSANIKNLGETISNLADKNDFEGKISIIKDDSLSLSDCKVLWAHGGVDRDMVQNTKTIEEIIKN